MNYVVEMNRRYNSDTADVSAQYHETVTIGNQNSIQYLNVSPNQLNYPQVIAM